MGFNVIRATHFKGLMKISLGESPLAYRKYISKLKFNSTAASWSITCHYLSTSKSYNKQISLFMPGHEFGSKTALIDQHGASSYTNLLSLAVNLKDVIIERSSAEKVGSLCGSRVAFHCNNDASYLVTLWAIWMSGGVAVPLCKSHPATELQYFINDSDAKLVVCTDDHAEKMKSVAGNTMVPVISLNKHDYYSDKVQNEDCAANTPLFEDEDPAIIIYTSGTTGKPKGVVHTYDNLLAMLRAMTESWKWTADDVILHVLPLHHVHGIVNCLLTPLYSGATCRIMPSFSAEQVWNNLLGDDLTSADVNSRQTNVFMAVPTIYGKLLAYYQKHLYLRKQEIREKCQKKYRLMVSGSAALPESIMNQWEELTGHLLLERYGMTEVGMALTNPFEGKRVKGAVGRPFPGVEVMIARTQGEHDDEIEVIVKGNAQTTEVTQGLEDESGQLYIRGPQVFKEYLNKPKATLESFTSDGWFKTGDTACYSGGVYRILGRTSADIIKSGGFKISALDIERHLLEHPSISEVIVVGIPDEIYGQQIAAVVTLRENKALDFESLKSWCSDLMPKYQIPRFMYVWQEIPRNVMGKVNKKDIIKVIMSGAKQ